MPGGGGIIGIRGGALSGLTLEISFSKLKSNEETVLIVLNDFIELLTETFQHQNYSTTF